MPGSFLPNCGSSRHSVQGQIAAWHERTTFSNMIGLGGSPFIAEALPGGVDPHSVPQPKRRCVRCMGLLKSVFEFASSTILPKYITATRD